MASFSAELRVAGQVFPVRYCQYAATQATEQRGRVNAKVRHNPVSITLDVPESDFLTNWAADSHKQLAVEVVFLEANGGAALETLSLQAAYCVSYEEVFAAGDADTGAYQCSLILSDPTGFTIQAGGPAAAFVAPAAGTHDPALLPLATQAVAVAGTAATAAGKRKLIAGSDEHKAQRWRDFQARNAAKAEPWSYERWEKQYYTNMRNTSVGLAREAEYRQAMNAESKTLKTPLTQRQIDMYIGDELYCGQLKTGKMGLNKQARTEDIPKDGELIKAGYQVEYILEKGGSKPFLTALDRIGASYKIGPQIP
jgi:hypothetical protein